MKPSELLQRIVKAEQIADKGALYELGRELDRLHGDGTRHEYGLRDILDQLKVTTWKPTLWQNGAQVAATVTYARYQVVSGMVDVRAKLVPTAAGAAGTLEVRGLPFSGIQDEDAGGIIYYDASVPTHYRGAAIVSAAATNLVFVVSGNAAVLGVTPAFAVAVGDTVRIRARYEIAPER